MDFFIVRSEIQILRKKTHPKTHPFSYDTQIFDKTKKKRGSKGKKNSLFFFVFFCLSRTSNNNNKTQRFFYHRLLERVFSSSEFLSLCVFGGPTSSSKTNQTKRRKSFSKTPFFRTTRGIKHGNAVDRATVRRSRRVFARHVLAFSLATKCCYAETWIECTPKASRALRALRERVSRHSRVREFQEGHFEERESVETIFEDQSDRGEVRFRKRTFWFLSAMRPFIPFALVCVSSNENSGKETDDGCVRRARKATVRANCDSRLLHTPRISRVSLTTSSYFTRANYETGHLRYLSSKKNFRQRKPPFTLQGGTFSMSSSTSSTRPSTTTFRSRGSCLACTWALVCSS